MSLTKLSIELNIALIPNASLTHTLAHTSQQLAKQYPAIVQLEDEQARLSMAPHLTLYQVPLLLRDLSAAHEHLAALASKGSPFSLQATHYLYNAGEASFEVDYQTTSELLALQRQVIDALNPLRGELLLERDPAGNAMTTFLSQTGTQSDDVRHSGYWEVGDSGAGGFFRPHATLNWFALGTNVATNDPLLPAITTHSGIYEAIGLFALGPHGSCPQRLAQYPLG